MFHCSGACLPNSFQKTLWITAFNVGSRRVVRDTYRDKNTQAHTLTLTIYFGENILRSDMVTFAAVCHGSLTNTGAL